MQFEILMNTIAAKLLGGSMVNSIVAKKGKFNFKDYLKCRAKIKMLKAEVDNSESHMGNLLRTCKEFLSPITSPLALISQIQRSGGSLLSQLLDGHPEVYAHPYELKIGFPNKFLWAKIDLNDRPERWFEMLFEDDVINQFKEGYKKGQQAEQRFAFIFFPSVQKNIFLTYLESIESVTSRDVFDAYMTSYFGAWLNNQNRLGQKKIVAAFTPRLAMIRESIKSFFEVYPDGRLISIVRDPANWYPSAVRHRPNKYGNIREAINLWTQSTEAMILNKQRYPQYTCIITFEDLINKMESVMRFLSDFLTIEFDETLLTPTFNNYPIPANTSFKTKKPGIVTSTLGRYKTLEKKELKIIKDMTDGVYQQVLKDAVKF